MTSEPERQYELLAEAAHELRTPLTSVQSQLELLAEELRGEQAEMAQTALRSTRRMRRLVDDLLLLSRVQAKRAPPREPVDLGALLLDAAAELAPIADGHELIVRAQAASVLGVRDDLYRLVLNLMENALWHTPAGTHVWAGTVTRDGEAVLTVEDDGPGMPPELERHAFERFARGAGADGGGGSGLGLAIVRTVAESHSGTVALARPAGGHGARFVVRLPAAPEPLPAQPLAAASPARRATGRR